MTKTLTPAQTAALRTSEYLPDFAPTDGRRVISARANTVAALVRLGLAEAITVTAAGESSVFHVLTPAGCVIAATVENGAPRLDEIAFAVANVLDASDAPEYEGYRMVRVPSGFHVVKGAYGVPVSLYPYPTQTEAVSSVRCTVNGVHFGDVWWDMLDASAEPMIYARLTGTPVVHHFSDTGEAYDATQTREDIQDGDVLVIESENVVGFLHRAWPIAITPERGHFHSAGAEDPRTLERRDGGDYSASVTLAESIATPAPVVAPIVPAYYSTPTTPGVFSLNCASRMGENRNRVADASGVVLSLGDVVRRTGRTLPPVQFRTEIIAGTEDGVIVGFEQGSSDDYNTYAAPVVQWSTIVRRNLSDPSHVLTSEGFADSHEGARLEIITPAPRFLVGAIRGAGHGVFDRERATWVVSECIASDAANYGARLTSELESSTPAA